MQEGMRRMGKTGGVVRPNTETQEYHAAKYEVFHRMHQDQLSYREIMARKPQKESGDL